MPEFERDIGVGEGQPSHHVAHVAGFGTFGFEELAPCRGVVEQVRDLDRRADRVGGGPEGLLGTARHGQGHASARGCRRCDGQPGDGCGAGQGLAAKAERLDAIEILGSRDLAGGEAADGEPQVVGRDARAIVLHDDALDAAVLDHCPDGTRARVEAVLDQFLDDGSRPFDDFAGGDLVGDKLGKLVDARH